MIRKEKGINFNHFRQVVPALIITCIFSLAFPGTPWQKEADDPDDSSVCVPSKFSSIVMEVSDECDKWSFEFLINSDDYKTYLDPDIPDEDRNMKQKRKKPRGIILNYHKIKEAPPEHEERPQPELTVRFFVFKNELAESRFNKNTPHNRPPPLIMETSQHS